MHNNSRWQSISSFNPPHPPPPTHTPTPPTLPPPTSPSTCQMSILFHLKMVISIFVVWANFKTTAAKNKTKNKQTQARNIRQSQTATRRVRTSTLTCPNSKHRFTTAFLQPLPLLLTHYTVLHKPNHCHYYWHITLFSTNPTTAITTDTLHCSPQTQPLPLLLTHYTVLHKPNHCHYYWHITLFSTNPTTAITTDTLHCSPQTQPLPLLLTHYTVLHKPNHCHYYWHIILFSTNPTTAITAYTLYCSPQAVDSLTWCSNGNVFVTTQTTLITASHGSLITTSNAHIPNKTKIISTKTTFLPEAERGPNVFDVRASTVR